MFYNIPSYYVVKLLQSFQENVPAINTNEHDNTTADVNRLRTVRLNRKVEGCLMSEAYIFRFYERDIRTSISPF